MCRRRSASPPHSETRPLGPGRDPPTQNPRFHMETAAPFSTSDHLPVSNAFNPSSMGWLGFFGGRGTSDSDCPCKAKTSPLGSLNCRAAVQHLAGPTWGSGWSSCPFSGEVGTGAISFTARPSQCCSALCWLGWICFTNSQLRWDSFYSPQAVLAYSRQLGLETPPLSNT